MASIKISQLNNLSAVTSDDFIPIVDSGSLTTFHTPISVLGDYMSRSGSAKSASWASESIDASGTASYAIKIKNWETFVKLLSTTAGNAVEVCSVSGLQTKTFLVSLHVLGSNTYCTKAYIICNTLSSPGISRPWSSTNQYSGWFTALPISQPHPYETEQNVASDYALELSQSGYEDLFFRVRTVKPSITTVGQSASLSIFSLNGWNQYISFSVGSGTEVVSSNDLPVWGSAFITQLGNYRFIVSGSIWTSQPITASLNGTASWSSNSITSSYIATASNAYTSSYSVYARTSSYAYSSSVSSELTYEKFVSVALPTDEEHTIDIGEWYNPYGTHNLIVGISVDNHECTVCKNYLIASNYKYTYEVPATWSELQPMASSGLYAGYSGTPVTWAFSDFALEASQSYTKLGMRIRRVTGSNAGTAKVHMWNIGERQWTTFTQTYNTAVSSNTCSKWAVHESTCATASYALTASSVFSSTGRDSAVKRMHVQADEMGFPPLTYNATAWIDAKDRLVLVGRSYDGFPGFGTTTAFTGHENQYAVFADPVEGVGVSKVYLNGINAYALMTDGSVFSAGRGSYYCIGDGSNTSRGAFVPMDTSNFSADEKVTGIRCSGQYNSVRGYGGSVALLTDLDNVYLLGTLRDYTTIASYKYRIPTLVESASLSGNCSDALILESSQPTWYFIRKSDGVVIGVGQNDTYQLGDGTTTAKRTNISADWITVLTPDPGEKVIKMVGNDGYADGTTYRFYAMFLTDGGKLYAVGTNRRGCCGFPIATTAVTAATQIPGLVGVNVVSASVGPTYTYWASACISSNGDLYTWGDNTYGQLARTTALTYDETPTIATTNVKKCAFQSNGTPYIVILKSDGRVFVSGYNINGALGFGTNTTVSTLTEIYYPSNTKGKIVDIGVSGWGAEYSIGHYDNVLLLTEDGDLFCAGQNTYGQCGIDPNFRNPIYEFSRLNKSF